MAFVELYTTTGNLIKDIVTQCTSINTNTLGASTIVDEARTVGESIAGLSTEKKIRLVYVPLNDSTFTFTKNGAPVSLAENTDYTIDAANRLITFVSSEIEVGNNLTVSYKGNRDWTLIYPASLDLITDKAIIKTKTSRIDSNLINTDLKVESNVTINEIDMYVKFERPEYLINPETGAAQTLNLLPGSEPTNNIVNNHYIEVTAGDVMNILGDDFATTAVKSEVYKLAWFQDFKESLIDDYDQGYISGTFTGTPTTGLTGPGIFLRGLKLPSYYDNKQAPIKVFINCNNDRINMALIGCPDISLSDYLVTYAYIGRVEGFKDKSTSKFYNKDVLGNFAITTGSSTIPSKKNTSAFNVLGINNSDVVNIQNKIVKDFDPATGDPIYIDWGIKDLSKSSYTDSNIKSVSHYAVFNRYLNTVYKSSDVTNDLYQEDTGNYSVSPVAWNKTKVCRDGATLEISAPSSSNANSVFPTAPSHYGHFGAFADIHLWEWKQSPTDPVDAGFRRAEKRRVSYAITFADAIQESRPVYLTFCVVDRAFFRDELKGNQMDPIPDANEYKLAYDELSIKPEIIFNPTTISLMASRGVRMNIYKAVPTATPLVHTEVIPAPLPGDATEYYLHDSFNCSDIVANNTYVDNKYLIADNTLGIMKTGTQLGINSVAGSSLPPSPYVTRDRMTGMINNIKYPDTYGENTGTGVTDIVMFKTRMGVPWQKHHASFTTNEEFMNSEDNSPSKWTNRVHASPVYVYHMADGYRGQLMDVIIVDKTNLITDDTLTLNKGSVDPLYPETVYKLIKIKVPYSFVNSGANHNYTIGIRMD